jgi:hypothetical protein
VSVAASYARRGWAVFPVRRDKAPATPNGLHDATTDPHTFARWRALRPAGIAIRTGEGLVVLDVDGDEGADTLRDLERKYGDLPHTPRAVTGGGGAHYYLASESPVPCSAGKVGPGLDIRGEGGYVVAPPSAHPSGRRYEWDVGPDDAPLASIPGWLAALAAPRRNGDRQPVPASEWRQLAQGVREGERNDATARLAGHLLGRRVDPLVTVELLAAWDAHRNQPPLGRDEVTRTVESIASRELAKGGRHGRA